MFITVTHKIINKIIEEFDPNDTLFIIIAQTILGDQRYKANLVLLNQSFLSYLQY